MNIFALMALVNMATSVVLGILVLLSNARGKSNRLFAAFAGAVALWSFSYFFWQISLDESVARFWIVWLMVGAVMIPFFYFHFVTTLLPNPKQFKDSVRAGYVLMSVFILLGFGGALVSDIVPRAGFPFWPHAGPLFTPFLVVWVFYAGYAAFLLLRRWWETEGSEQQRILLILLGTVIGYAGGCTNYFLWYDVNILPYGNVTASIYLGLVAYAIMKYRMFNMKVVSAQLITFSLWLFLFIRLFIANDSGEQVATAITLAFTLIAGVFLIRSVDKEVEQRERLEKTTKELEKANMRLKALDRQKSEFIGIAAHQLRTPIAAIKGYSSLILEGSYGRLTKKMLEPLQNIFNSSDRMADTIDDFLNVSRIEQGRMEYHKALMDLEDVVRKSIGTFELPAKEKGLSLAFASDTCPAGSHMVYADVAKIQHVINNLLDNAIKYTKTGGAEVALSCAKDGKSIRFSITDSGAGIPEDTLHELFDKFVRARNARQINVTGSGLGLYVAKQIIEAHDGKIWAESDGEGSGSTFVFELPLVSTEG